jgi:hypothetical protein
MKLVVAALTPLFLTLPSTSAVRSPSQCIGPVETADIQELRVYRTVEGGNPRLVLTKDVRGREGQADTVYVDAEPGASFHATVTDTAGNESCPSAPLAVDRVVLDDSEVVDYVVEIRRFDAHGRRVGATPASGVYWEMRRYLSGRIVTIKRVHLR